MIMQSLKAHISITQQKRKREKKKRVYAKFLWNPEICQLSP